MRTDRRALRCVLAVALLATATAVPMVAAGEVTEVRVGWGTGIGYLPLQVMAHHNLLEKHARASGLGEVKLRPVLIPNANAMNDALLSGAIELGSGGVSTFLPLWAKTQGGLGVKGVGALVAMPMYLNTRNPNVKSVKDFTEKDRIGVAGIKVSYQAMLVQMAAAHAFGDANYAKLDPLTVTVSNPDGVAGMTSSLGQITAHFTPPPFAYWELKTPGVHTILKSYDVLGGPATLNQVWATSRFRAENPKVFAAMFGAFQEATALLNKDRKGAAEVYLEASKDKKSSVADILEMLNDPEIQYSTTPNRVMTVVDFMHKVGVLRVKPASWKDLYFPEVQQLPGS